MTPSPRWDPELRLGRETHALSARTWPRYLVEPSDLPEPELRLELTRSEFARRFPVWGFRDGEGGELLAFMNGALLRADLAAERLPDDGWRYAIRESARNEEPNCLCLLSASVAPEWRGRGLSLRLIERARELAGSLGVSAIIAPVRPTRKHLRADLSMGEYAALPAEDGAPFDPWLRAHVAGGARVLNVCAQSVRIEATLPRWREWTGLPLLDGAVGIPGGLAPLVIDRSAGSALYLEPNVWVRYSL